MTDDSTYLADLITEFVDGWRERVEYGVRLQIHTQVCQAHRAALPAGAARHHQCRCPTRAEARVAPVHQPGLLAQLQAVREPARSGDTDGGRTQPGSKPPGSLAAADLLNHIKQDAVSARILLRDANNLDTGTPRPLVEELRGLVTLASTLPDEHPAVTTVITQQRRNRKQGRVLLGYDAPARQLRDVVCPDCGGTLTVPSDADGDVRCVGPGVVEGPAEQGHAWPVRVPGCGNLWRRHEWITLLDQAS